MGPLNAPGIQYNYLSIPFRWLLILNSNITFFVHNLKWKLKLSIKHRMRLRSFGAIPKKRYSEQKLICDLVHSQIEENSIAIIVLLIVKCMA